MYPDYYRYSLGTSHQMTRHCTDKEDNEACVPIVGLHTNELQIKTNAHDMVETVEFLGPVAKKTHNKFLF